MRTSILITTQGNKNRIRTSLIILFVLIFLFGTLSSTKNSLAYSYSTEHAIICNTPETDIALIYEEGVLEMYWEVSNEYFISSPILGIGAIFQINCTLLAISNTSVLFKFDDNPVEHWSPSPENITLLPGESFEATFTLESSEFQGAGEFAYLPTLLTEGSNATVNWWWKVLNKGEIAPGNSFVYTFGILLLFTTINALVLKKQRKKK